MGYPRILSNLVVTDKPFFQKVHRNRNAFLRFLNEFSTVLWSKHTLTEAVQCFLTGFRPFFLLFTVKESQMFCCRISGDPSFNHGRTCFFNARYISCYENTWNGCLSIFITFWHHAAFFRILDHLTAGALKKLGHRGQAHCQAYNIYVKMLLGPRFYFPVRSYFSNRNTGYFFFSLSLHNGVGQVKRYSHTG